MLVFYTFCYNIYILYIFRQYSTLGDMPYQPDPSVTRLILPKIMFNHL